MAVRVERRAEEGNEAVRGRALDEDFVEARDDIGQRQVAGELGLERALGHCGEQRGGDPFARNVAEHEGGAVLFERYEIVEIAPDVTRRDVVRGRSEEHTSELQSLRHLVCRLLLEKKKNKKNMHMQMSRSKNNSVRVVSYTPKLDTSS